MDTQHIEFTTANGGQKVVLRPFLTGDQKFDINAVLIDAPENEPKSIRSKAWVKAKLTAVVISIDGETENVADKVFNLDARDFEEITDRVDEVISNKKKGSS